MQRDQLLARCAHIVIYRKTKIIVVKDGTVKQAVESWLGSIEFGSSITETDG